MGRWWTYVKLAPEGLLVLLISIIIVDMVVGVVSRYAMRHPFPWVEDVGSISLLGITFIGAAVAVKRGAHFALTALTETLPASVRKAIGIVSCLLLALSSVALVITGISLMRIARGTRLAGLDIPLTLAYVVVPVGGALMFVYSLAPLLGFWKSAAPVDSGQPGRFEKI